MIKPRSVGQGQDEGEGLTESLAGLHCQRQERATLNVTDTNPIADVKPDTVE